MTNVVRVRELEGDLIGIGEACDDREAHRCLVCLGDGLLSLDDGARATCVVRDVLSRHTTLLRRSARVSSTLLRAGIRRAPLHAAWVLM